MAITSAELVSDVRTAVAKADAARRAADEAAARLIAGLAIPGTYRAFLPKVDDHLVVTFPGEAIRCPVVKVIGDDTVLIHLNTVPMAKSHNFGFDKHYGVRRRVRNGRDVWEAQQDREFLAEQERVLAARPKPEAMKKVAPASKATKKKGRK